MKKILLVCVLVWGSNEAISQNFIYPLGQHIVADVQMANYEPYWIEINTPAPQAITYAWQRLSNTFPAAWSYSLCDYGNCAVGIPSSGVMDSISLTDAQNGTIGFLHLNLTVGANYGQGKVEIYVYDITDYANGDTVSWDIRWLNTSGLDEMSDANVQVYPNPTSELITIDIQDPSLVALYRLMDMHGQVLFQEKNMTASTTVNVSGLSSGFYFLELIDENGLRQTKKIQKN